MTACPLTFLGEEMEVGFLVRQLNLFAGHLCLLELRGGE